MDQHPPTPSPKSSTPRHSQPLLSSKAQPRPPPPSQQPTCPDHRQQLLFCCFDCPEMLCCARCVSIGKHRNHDVKNLHRSYILVETSLSEFLIRLGAKIDLYSLYHEKMSISRSETVQEYCEVQRKIINQFRSVKQQIQQKQAEIIALIETQSTLRQQQFNNALTDIRLKIKVCMQSHQMIQEQIRQLSEVSLCRFYAEQKQYFEQLLSDEHSAGLQRPQINLNLGNYDRLVEAVKDLRLSNASAYQRKRGVGRTSVDLQARMGGSREERRYIVRESIPNTPLLQTPQNRELEDKEPPTIKHTKGREITIFQSKQSRKTLKMFSMPSSPLKDNKKESPLHYLQLQKKSFIMGKKNC